jgi:hypothetical protein
MGDALEVARSEPIDGSIRNGPTQTSYPIRSRIARGIRDRRGCGTSVSTVLLALPWCAVDGAVDLPGWPGAGARRATSVSFSGAPGKPVFGWPFQMVKAGVWERVPSNPPPWPLFVAMTTPQSGGFPRFRRYVRSNHVPSRLITIRAQK